MIGEGVAANHVIGSQMTTKRRRKMVGKLIPGLNGSLFRWIVVLVALTAVLLGTTMCTTESATEEPEETVT